MPISVPPDDKLDLSAATEGAEAAARDARTALDAPGAPGSSELALAAATALSGPAWAAALARAMEESASSEPVAPEMLRCVELAVATREALDRVASHTLDPALLSALDDADSSLEPFGSAVALLDDEAYERAVGDGWVDPTCWWASEAKLPASARLDDAIDALAQERRRRALRPPVDASVAMRVMASLAPLSSGPLSLFSSLEGLSPEALPSAAALHAPRARVAHASGQDASAALRALAQAGPSNVAERFRTAMAALDATPCPWLRHELKGAAASLVEASRTRPELAPYAPAIEAMVRQAGPGRVSVLAAIAGHELASMWELQVRFREETAADPWEGAMQLREVARDAIRAAYHAVSALLGGLAPRTFDDHTFVLVAGDELAIDAIDGPSLALSAAIAFASLWANRGPAVDIAASARLSLRPGSPPSLLPVGHLPAKAAALARIAGAARLLTAQDDANALLPPGITLRPLATLADALREAGLDPSGITISPWAGGEEQRRRLLADLAEDVETQHLEPYRGRGLDPWLVLADRMRQLVDSLVQSKDARTLSTLGKSRPRAALAFTHAMDDAGAASMLEGLPLDRMPPAQAHFAQLAALGQAIDRKDWASCEALEASLASLEPSLSGFDRDALLGLALGTRGRARMHRGALAEALPLLEAAVSHHEQLAPREVGRSRIYLAVARRLSGDARGSLETLERAAQDLLHCRETIDRAYAVQTSIFLHYEMARSLLAADQAQAAVAVGERAVSMARNSGNWWPLLGALRTLAWAYRATGRGVEADALANELGAWAARDTPLAATLRDEAAGAARSDGEVY